MLLKIDKIQVVLENRLDFILAGYMTDQAFPGRFQVVFVKIPGTTRRNGGEIQ
jgi:hypothetical protein